ncbi:hypothetical protein BCR44DRAFT_156448 [Catenaria anguillulae PL171]|uniref:Thioredoxin-like fold domain-containing protein n=1 Tax=Catenaria anguillulae PL171 TaxID=765915 RepID=A0A1Y2H6Y5_9FUNG|nr:hypothetical protein BCR44DRAFT_156448 [Catenaria anguillulae PL171]
MVNNRNDTMQSPPLRQPRTKSLSSASQMPACRHVCHGKAASIAALLVASALSLLMIAVPQPVDAAPATVQIRNIAGLHQGADTADPLQHPLSLASRLSSRASGTLSTLRDWHGSFNWIWSWHPFASTSSSHQVQQRAIAFFECQQAKLELDAHRQPERQQGRVNVAAIPPPPTPQGFLLNNGHGSIQVTAFLDPLCPDSADFWTGFSPAAKAFATLASFRVVVLPLPYHRNAFAISQGLQAVHRRIVPGAAAAEPISSLFDHSFSHIETLSNRSQIISELDYRTATADWIWTLLSPEVRRNVFLGDIKNLIEDLEPGAPADQAARAQFKYAASLGVTGTPEVQVNGVLDAQASELRTVAEWSEYFKSLSGQ